MVVDKILAGPLRPSPSQFLGAARLAFVTTIDPAGSPHVWATGGSRGFVSQLESDGSLCVPIPEARRAEVAESVEAHPFAGMLLVIPGLRHTLRVNGTATVRDGDSMLVVSPNQTYAHCAKAFIRSELWAPDTSRSSRTSVATSATDGLNEACADFIEASPFVALGTSLVDGEADVSPRGDPSGFVRMIDQHTLFLPDRPGNRIADSLRNIVANPKASLLFVVPGDEHSLEVVGDAHVTTDDELCKQAAVKGNVPKLGIVINVDHATLRHDLAITNAGAWATESYANPADVPTIGAMVADPNDRSTLAARLKTSATDRVTDLDYRFKLY